STCNVDLTHTPNSITCNGVVTTCPSPPPPTCGDLGYACPSNTLCCDYAGGFACRHPDPRYHQCPVGPCTSRLIERLLSAVATGRSGSAWWWPRPRRRRRSGRRR